MKKYIITDKYTMKITTHNDYAEMNIRFKQTICENGQRYKMYLCVWSHDSDVNDVNHAMFDCCFYIDRIIDNKLETVADTGIRIYGFNDKEYISIQDNKFKSPPTYANMLSNKNGLAAKFNQPEYFTSTAILKLLFFKQLGL